MAQRMPLLVILSAVFISVSQTVLNAQTSCSLKLVELPAAPEMRGFRLGMTKDDVRLRVPQVVFARDDEFGVSKTTINPDFDPKIDKASFSGIRSVSLDFLDSKLSSLWFGYDSSFGLKTVEDFVQGISASLKLPAAWQSWRVRGQQLKCADFSMTVSVVAEGVSFRIVDTAAEDLIAERRLAKEEERASASEEEETESEPVVGDKRSKTYFTADCLPTKPIESKDQVEFQSAAEAERAGYKKAKGCSQ
jgi:hypothetical protein